MRQAEPDALSHALRELALSFVRDVPPHTLSRSATSTLSSLERLGPQRITALAEREVVTQPAMTGLVQRLEGVHYVTRSADPEDGRASLVSITPTGAAALAARRRSHDQAIAERLSHLSPEDHDLLVAALPALANLVQDKELHAVV